MRLIDANDVKRRGDCYLPDIRKTIANIISHTKTVKDAVVIVRCKDCKYFHENVFGGEIGIGAPYDNLIVGHCGCSRFAGDNYMIYMDPDGFCSLGERREP